MHARIAPKGSAVGGFPVITRQREVIVAAQEYGTRAGEMPRPGGAIWLDRPVSYLFRGWFRVTDVQPSTQDGWVYLIGHDATKSDDREWHLFVDAVRLGEFGD